MRAWAAAVVSLLVGASCGSSIDDGLLYIPGFGAIRMKTAGPGGATESEIRGPARLRRLTPTEMVITARFLRPAAAGLRRGDLTLRLTLPVPFDLGVYFLGAPTVLSATYEERDRTSAETAFYAGGGNARLEITSYGPLPVVHIALDVALEHKSGAGPQSVMLLGLISTGDDFEGGITPVSLLGLGIWAEAFDPEPVFANPDVDFGVYVRSGNFAELEWVMGPGGPYADTYGYFDDAGYVGYDSEPDFWH